MNDVFVVGGGPGGLMTSLLLLRSGWSVHLAERAPSLDRGYRGEILQPGGQALLDEVGVLSTAVERGALDLGAFELCQDGRALLTSDYARLPGPHNRLLSVPQDHLIGALLDACCSEPGFTWSPGASVLGVEAGGEAVTVALRHADGRREERARCVVGADGRHSAVRRLRSLPFDRDPGGHFDVLWCKLAPGTGTTGKVRILRHGGPPVLAYDSWPGQLQLGLTVPHGSAKALLGDGVGPVVALLQAALPERADAIAAALRRPTDLSVLDAFSGIAGRWGDDRTVLVGDAAHTHSPLGAQGINLALGDAAVLHPILDEALRSDELGAASLGRFADARRPAIEAVLSMQAHQARGLLGDRHGPARVLQPLVMRAVSASPVGAAITRMVAYGKKPVTVRRDLFRTTRPTTSPTPEPAGAR